MKSTNNCKMSLPLSIPSTLTHSERDRGLWLFRLLTISHNLETKQTVYANIESSHRHRLMAYYTTLMALLRLALDAEEQTCSFSCNLAGRGQPEGIVRPFITKDENVSGCPWSLQGCRQCSILMLRRFGNVLGQAWGQAQVLSSVLSHES